MEQATKRADCPWKGVSFTFFFGERNGIIEQIGHTVVQDFSKIKQTTGTDQASLTVACLRTANILLRDRMMEFFLASWDASL